jgi:quercetin dioxygenase-like cupin family protein
MQCSWPNTTSLDPATLQVLPGRVQLATSEESWELGWGDHMQIPSIRHRLDRLEDAAVLLP